MAAAETAAPAVVAADVYQFRKVDQVLGTGWSASRSVVHQVHRQAHDAILAWRRREG